MMAKSAAPAAEREPPEIFSQVWGAAVGVRQIESVVGWAIAGTVKA